MLPAGGGLGTCSYGSKQFGVKIRQYYKLRQFVSEDSPSAFPVREIVPLHALCETCFQATLYRIPCQIVCAAVLARVEEDPSLSQSGVR